MPDGSTEDTATLAGLLAAHRHDPAADLASRGARFSLAGGWGAAAAEGGVRAACYLLREWGRVCGAAAGDLDASGSPQAEGECWDGEVWAELHGSVSWGGRGFAG